MQIENDLLEQSYVKSSRPELAELIKDVMKPFSMLIRERKLKCQIHQQTSIPVTFYIEKKLYMEILYNLMQNAVKFNKPQGSILTTLCYDEVTGKLWTSIEDTGIGIRQDIKKRLFKGFGIGLCNSKSLVEALNGKIDV